VRALPGRREAGVTLIEALVVLAILGLVTAIVAVPLNSYWQRSRLQSVAGDIRSFLQTAYTEATTQHSQITVTLQQNTTTGNWQLQLSPVPPGLTAAQQAIWLQQVGTYNIPDWVSLADNPAAAAGGWPTADTSHPPASGATSALICDTMSRTLCPVGFVSCDATATSPAQITNVRTLSMTHTSMADGSLRPNTRFDIQVYPVWNIVNQKVIL
jgi:type II secretory pathway pseudopilin PulG